MKTAPLISLGLSAVLGIGAVFLGKHYMTAESNDASAQAAAPAIEMATVLVAATTIEPGEEVSGGLVKTIRWPADSVPAGVVRDVAELDATKYSRALILPGEPIMLEKLDDAGNALTLAASIEPGMRAVAITVRNDTGVAGFVLPGDRVDVNEFVEKDPSKSSRYYEGDMLRTSGNLVARPILRNVKVLAIDQTFDSGLEGARVSSTVTLEVTPEGALVLGAAGMQGALGLALIGREEEAVIIQVVKEEPKKTAVSRPVYRGPRTTNVRVINGDKETNVDAPVSQSKPKQLTKENS